MKAKLYKRYKNNSVIIIEEVEYDSLPELIKYMRTLTKESKSLEEVVAKVETETITIAL